MGSASGRPGIPGTTARDLHDVSRGECAAPTDVQSARARGPASAHARIQTLEDSVLFTLLRRVDSWAFQHRARVGRTRLFRRPWGLTRCEPRGCAPSLLLRP